jgi:cyclohexyl-isocyanide hydratase
MAQEDTSTPAADPTVAMLLYPAFTALDLIGPHAVLTSLPGRKVHLVWKNRDIVVSDNGVPIQPTLTFAETPAQVEILFVPGGTRGTVEAIMDPEILDFVASRGERATHVTSVCTGSLVLGAAGLLRGYRATSHWSVRHLLPLCGAEAVTNRVVADRNRITGAGVTAGIDFGLTLLARLTGETSAKASQLGIEYDPEPPFQSGSPEEAEPEITAMMTQHFAFFVDRARDALRNSPGHVAG